MSDKAIILRPVIPANSDPYWEGFVVDQEGAKAGSVLANHYYSQSLADEMIDYALKNKKSLAKLGTTISDCDWRDETPEDDKSKIRYPEIECETFKYLYNYNNSHHKWFYYNPNSGGWTTECDV